MADRTIPPPEQLEGFLGDIEEAVGQLRVVWRWAYPNAYRRPTHGSADVVSGGEAPDVADVVAATERFRVHLRSAGRHVRNCRNEILGALNEVRDAMPLLDTREVTPEVADVRFIPHPADRGDLARAKAAQGRRKKRAEASGDWGEVTG